MRLKINKPRVAIFSDLHLGVHTNSSEWHNYAVEWANWFKDECKRNNIKDIIGVQKELNQIINKRLTNLEKINSEKKES